MKGYFLEIEVVFDIKAKVMKLGWVTWIQVNDEFMFRNVILGFCFMCM